jgi:hypothetical protein
MRPSLTAASVLCGLSVLGSAGCGGAGPNEVVPVTVASPVTMAGSSEAAPRTPARNALDAPGAFAIVEEETGWLIVDDEVKDDALAGAPVDTSPPKSGVHVLEAKLKLADLGPEMRLEGRSFALYRGAEKKCVVRAGALRAVGFTSDDFTPDEENPSAPRPTPEEQAREKWAASNTYVAARVALAPECKGASWARLEELPEPRFATSREPNDPIAAKALTAFQSRPRWIEAQRSYVEAIGAEARAKTGADPGTWEDLGSVTLSELGAPFAGGSFVVRQSVWDEGCGANAGLTMVWRDVGGSLTPVYEADDRFRLEVAMDLDGDGKLEMFGTEGDGPSLRAFWGTDAEEERQGPYLTHAYAFHGCRC